MKRGISKSERRKKKYKKEVRKYKGSQGKCQEEKRLEVREADREEVNCQGVRMKVRKEVQKEVKKM